MATASATTITVDDDGMQFNANYNNIASAVLKARPGDTIKIYPGTYNSFTIDKRLDVIGINHPVIKPVRSGITVNAGYSTIEGVTIKGGNYGIYVNSNEVTIRDNIIVGNNRGIYVTKSHASIISDNVISHNDYGVYLTESYDNLVSNNKITDCRVGVYLEDADKNHIKENTISNNRNDGVHLVFSYANEVSNNKIYSNNLGITLIGASQNTIKRNTVANSHTGISLITYERGTSYIPCKDNKIFLNNFVDNSNQAYLYLKSKEMNTWNSPKISYTYKGSQYTQHMGNNWSDFYEGDKVDDDNNGIYDGYSNEVYGYPIVNSYKRGSEDNRKDIYPLAEKWEYFFGETYNILPEVSFTYKPSDPGNNTPIDFKASASDPDGHIVSYEWRFGDGETIFGENPTHNYEYPGRYTVTLTATDDDGEASSIAKVVTIHPNTTPAEEETVSDNVNDIKEQVVSKYNTAFDWTTQKPNKSVVVDAVTTAVKKYFKPDTTQAEKEQIVDDVTTLVQLYFSPRI